VWTAYLVGQAKEDRSVIADWGGTSSEQSLLLLLKKLASKPIIRLM
jgi:hypothetical protein